MRPLRRLRTLRFPKHDFTYPPVAHEGDVYLSDSSHSVMRLKRPTYEVMWSRPSDGFQYWSASGTSLVGTLGHSATVLSTVDGAVRWTERFDSSPVVLGDSLFAPTSAGDLIERDLLSGALVSTTRIFDGPAKVFCVAGKRMLLELQKRDQGLPGLIRCLDSTSGTVLWENRICNHQGDAIHQPSWGEAKRHIYSNDELVLLRWGFEVIALRTATGDEAWRATVPMVHYPLPVVAFDRVFLLGGSTLTTITCLRVTDGRVEWTCEMEGSRPHGLGPAHQGTVVLLCLGGLLLFLDPESGEVVSRYDGPQVGSFGVAAAGDDLLLSTEYGRIHVARPKGEAA